MLSATARGGKILLVGAAGSESRVDSASCGSHTSLLAKARCYPWAQPGRLQKWDGIPASYRPRAALSAPLMGFLHSKSWCKRRGTNLRDCLLRSSFPREPQEPFHPAQGMGRGKRRWGAICRREMNIPPGILPRCCRAGLSCACSCIPA